MPAPRSWQTSGEMAEDECLARGPLHPPPHGNPLTGSVIGNPQTLSIVNF